MKKCFALLLSLLLILSFTACAGAPAAGEELPTQIPAATESVQQNAVEPEKEPAVLSFEESVEWDAEYDVVVIGYGAAGAVTAVTASDTGADVLLVEKASKGLAGGNSRVCAQSVYAPTDLEGTKTYLTALFDHMRAGVSDTLIEKYAETLCTGQDWLKEITGLEELPASVNVPEYPQFPCSDTVIKVTIDGKWWGAAFYHMLEEQVEQRPIDVWYQAPGKHLIQDPETKIIHGVEVEKDGVTYCVRAKNGVVLCTGGFEANMDMVQNYLQATIYPTGSIFNTGDGIVMAQEVGANLWHMSSVAGPSANFKSPNLPYVFGPYMHDKNGFGTKCIFVGSDGTRFTNEASLPKHGHVSYHGDWKLLQIPSPAYAIFDQTAMESRAIYPYWSDDNSEELAKSWIIQGDTLGELAEKMGIDPEGLVAQVETYNQYCANGADEDFGRNPDTLTAIGTGPYYAMEVVASMLNTMGGPVRNENGEVLNTAGEPIPHLYSAGELGSIFGSIYQGSGNLAECIAFGRISGASAAIEKNDVVQESLVQGEGVDFETVEPEFELAENELLGCAKGMGGNLYVKVVMDADLIEDVEVLYQNETPGICEKALERVPAAIVEAQSVEVDVVTGATCTANAIKAAVQDALSSR